MAKPTKIYVGLRLPSLAVVCTYLCASGALQAQEFKILNREIQVHGFASQGYVDTADNNWLTMNTKGGGSFGFTEMSLNLSTPVTDNLRAGAQVYDRNLGQLGQYHPSLDWAMMDYRFRSWFGLRGGKVKTVFGLYNDSQDQDFLRTFALLPQSVYPTDLRDALIAHLGVDLYGEVHVRHRLGDLSYTAFTGHRHDSIYSGGAYIASRYGIQDSTFSGLQYGADLRWRTPLNGFVVGASRLNEDVSDRGMVRNPELDPGMSLPYTATDKSDWTNQFYGEYTRGKLRVDSEFRRHAIRLLDEVAKALGTTSENVIVGWYVSGTYRVMKRLAVGSYYSRYTFTSRTAGPLALFFPDQTDTSDPLNHVYDKVVTARVDLKKYWNVKVEGHFMNGVGVGTYPDGFYPEQNPAGFKPDTNALVVRTSINF